MVRVRFPYSIGLEREKKIDSIRITGSGTSTVSPSCHLLRQGSEESAKTGIAYSACSMHVISKKDRPPSHPFVKVTFQVAISGMNRFGLTGQVSQTPLGAWMTMSPDVVSFVGGTSGMSTSFCMTYRYGSRLLKKYSLPNDW